MRALVAGAAGFIGSHLCDALLARGVGVVGLDNYSTGCRSNLAHLAGNRAFSFVRHDVAGPLLPMLPRADIIFNLACPASPRHYQADPIRTMLTNVVGTNKLLEYAYSCDARFIQASTSEVYGDPEVHPQAETYWGNVNPNGPRACYDEGKRAAETLAFDYRRMHGLDVRVARLFNTYGPRMQPNDGRVVSNFIAQALQGEPITIYGDGSQTRSFCFVDDMVDGLIRLALHDEPIDGPINLGNPSEVTVAELAELVLALTGSTSLIVHKPLPADDPKRRKPDIKRAKDVLGWAPRTVSLVEEGLKRTIEWLATDLSSQERRHRALLSERALDAHAL